MINTPQTNIAVAEQNAASGRIAGTPAIPDSRMDRSPANYNDNRVAGDSVNYNENEGRPFASDPRVLKANLDAIEIMEAANKAVVALLNDTVHSQLNGVNDTRPLHSVWSYDPAHEDGGQRLYQLNRNIGRDARLDGRDGRGGRDGVDYRATGDRAGDQGYRDYRNPADRLSLAQEHAETLLSELGSRKTGATYDTLNDVRRRGNEVDATNILEAAKRNVAHVLESANRYTEAKANQRVEANEAAERIRTQSDTLRGGTLRGDMLRDGMTVTAQEQAETLRGRTPAAVTAQERAAALRGINSGVKV